MKLKGSIVQFKSRINASGDRVNTLSLEVFGDQIPAIYALLKKPLDITLDEGEAGPFE